MPKLNYPLLTLIWTLVILILCFLPSSNLPTPFFFEMLDKIVHAGLYFVLALLIALSIFRRWEASIGKYLMIIFICIFLGCIIEYLQPIVSDRNFETYDIVANSIGAIGGSVFYVFVLKGIKRN